MNSRDNPPPRSYGVPAKRLGMQYRDTTRNCTVRAGLKILAGEVNLFIFI